MSAFFLFLSFFLTYLICRCVCRFGCLSRVRSKSSSEVLVSFSHSIGRWCNWGISSSSSIRILYSFSYSQYISTAIFLPPYYIPSKFPHKSKNAQAKMNSRLDSTRHDRNTHPNFQGEKGQQEGGHVAGRTRKKGQHT